MKLIGGLLILFMGCSSLSYKMETADNRVIFYKSDNELLLTSERYIDTDNDGKIDMIRSLYKKQEASFWLMAYYKLYMIKSVLDEGQARYRNLPLYREVQEYKIRAFHLTFDMDKDNEWDFAIIDRDGDGLMEHLICRANCDSLMKYYGSLND